MAWKTISNGGGGKQGLNNGGVAVFNSKAEGNIVSVIREAIQNSLDARRKDSPFVRVEIDLDFISLKDIPDGEVFREKMNLCWNSVKNRKEGEKSDDARFLENALNLLSSDQIPILRISDYGTTGLLGAKSRDDDSKWESLVMNEGFQKTGELGGHGLGKNALFGLSSLRTLFFSSIDSEEGFESHAGVSKLSSFQDPDIENAYTTGHLYYLREEEGKLKAISGQAPFPGCNRRQNEYGTDVLILGVDAYWDVDKEILKKEAILHVLVEFMICIHQGVLKVHVLGETIESSSLARLVDRHLEPLEWEKKSHREQKNKIKEYFNLITSEEIPWERTLETDNFTEGAFRYKFTRSENLNECIIVRDGMRVERFKRLGTAYCGIVLIEGEKEKKLFARMEDASHTKFTPENSTRFPNSKERNFAKKTLKGFKLLLENIISEKLKSPDGEQIDATLPTEILELLKEITGKKRKTKDGFSPKAQRASRRKSKEKKSMRPEKGEELDPDPEEGDGVGTGAGTSGSGTGTGVRSSNTSGMSPKFKPKAFLVEPRFCAQEHYSSGKYKCELTIPVTAKIARIAFTVLPERGRSEPVILLGIEKLKVLRKGAEVSLEHKIIENGKFLEFCDIQKNDIIIATFRFNINYLGLFEIELTTATPHPKANES